MRRVYEGKDSALTRGDLKRHAVNAGKLFGKGSLQLEKSAEAIVPICKYWDGLNKGSSIMNEVIHP
jgi:hypothetical protein